VNAAGKVQVVVPSDAVGDMLSYVARVQDLLALVSMVLIGLTAILISLVTALSVRVRQREMLTLSRVGASRRVIFAIFAWELGLLIAIGMALALAAAWWLWVHPPDLMKWL
jgi:ABC-type lipoprotein release transport system permease subunit